MEKQEIKLWAFYYNPMIWESSAEIVSYHRTEAGSTKAMELHKSKEREEFDRVYSDRGWKPTFGQHEYWCVREFLLKIEE